MTDIKLFNKYKSEFDLYQRYFETYSNSKSFIEEYNSIRDNFLKYKYRYESLTKDYKINSSYITIGKVSYEFITPTKFNDLMKKTNISETERKILNGSYIGSTFSWNLNSKLRNSQQLQKAELFIKKTLSNVINKNIISENYKCKKYVHYDYLEKVFHIYPSKLSDKVLEELLDSHIGEIIEEKGFLSCSMTNNQVIDGEGLINFYVHSGTKAFITDNIKETEIIFDCGTKYIFFGYNVNSNNKTRFVLNVLIIRLKNN